MAENEEYEIQRLKRRQLNLEAEITTLNGKIKTLEEELEHKTSKTATLEKELMKSATSIDNLNKEVIQWQNRTTMATDNEVKAINKYAELKKEVDGIANHNEKMRTELSYLKSNTESQINRFVAGIEDLRSDIMKRKIELRADRFDCKHDGELDSIIERLNNLKALK